MTVKLKNWLERVSNEDAESGAVSATSSEKPVEDAVPGTSEEASVPEVTAAATENAEGGPAADDALTTGSDGGANAGEVEGGAAAPVVEGAVVAPEAGASPVEPIAAAVVPQGPDAGTGVVDGALAANAPGAVEGENAAAPQVGEGLPAPDATGAPIVEGAAAEVTETSNEDALSEAAKVDPEGTAKPINDKNVKVEIETAAKEVTGGSNEDALDDAGNRVLAGTAEPIKAEKTEMEFTAPKGDEQQAAENATTVSTEDALSEAAKVDPEGTAKPVSDATVKAHVGEAAVGEAGSAASEEATSASNEEEGEVLPFDMPDSESEVQIANRHMNEVADDLDRIDVVSTALEQYHALLTHAIDKDGVVSPTLAKSIRIGLEAFGEQFLLDGVPSNEDFAVATTQHEASNKSVAATEGKMKQMMEIARAAVKKLLEWLADIWNGIMHDTGALVTKLDEVKAKVDSIRSTNEKRMVVNGADRLSIGGFFVGDTAAPIRVVNDTVEYFVQDYPKVLTKTVKAIKDGLKGFLQGHDVADGQLMSVISDAVSDNLKFVGMPTEKAKAEEIPAKFNKSSAVARTKVFPGNMALFYVLLNKSAERAGLDESQSLAFQFSNIFQVEFARLANAKMLPSGGDGVKVPDARVLKQMVAECAALLATLEDLKDAKRNNELFAKEVEDLGRDWYSRNMGVAWASNGQQLMNGLSKAYATPSGNLIGYVASLAKAYVAILDRFADHHGATGGAGQTVNGSASRVGE
jgi:hypothetical protein